MSFEYHCVCCADKFKQMSALIQERVSLRSEVERLTKERDELLKAVADHMTARSELRAKVESLTKVLEAYKRAKQENDERFQAERDDAKRKLSRAVEALKRFGDRDGKFMACFGECPSECRGEDCKFAQDALRDIGEAN